jgi:hypothetical protein
MFQKTLTLTRRNPILCIASRRDPHGHARGLHHLGPTDRAGLTGIMVVQDGIIRHESYH